MNITENIVANGSLTVRQGIFGAMNKDQLISDLAAVVPIPLDSFRVWDAFKTPLGTAAADDAGMTAGAFATGCPYIHSLELNAAGSVTQYARVLVTLPISYVAGQEVKVNLAGGMLTSVASVAATVDVEAYKTGRDALITGSDLCTTSATTINSLTFAEVPFTLTATGLSPGDMLDIRITFASNSATASSHFAAIAAAELQITSKG